MRPIFLKRVLNRRLEVIERVDLSNAWNAGGTTEISDIQIIGAGGRNAAGRLVDLVIEYDVAQVFRSYPAYSDQSVHVHDHGAIAIQHGHFAMRQRHGKAQARGRAAAQSLEM